MNLKFLFFLFLFFPIVSFSEKVPDCFGVPIEQAMGLSESNIKKAFCRGEWKIVRDLYNRNAVNAVWSEVPRIPKIIHHIWLGSPFPEKYKILRETWKKHHPDWEFVLWTDEDIEAFGLFNKDLYDQSDNYGAKSDIARYEILYRFGGLYIDTDFESEEDYNELIYVHLLINGRLLCLQVYFFPVP